MWQFLRSGRFGARAAIAAVALAVVLVALAIEKWRSAGPTVTEAAPPQSASPPSSGTTTRSDAVAAPVLAEFRAAITTGSPGEWSILKTSALAASDRGAWDDYRVGSPVVMKEGSTYRMWFIGCRLARDQHDCGIGHATSGDGVEWRRDESPVFVPPDLPAPHWLGTLAIVKTANDYQMWYSLDGDRFVDRPLGTLHMATSADGLAWQNVGLVHTAAGRRTIRHAVHREGQKYHLWYADVTDDGGESFLHLASSDGRTWTAAGGDMLGGRAASVGRPWVIADGRGGFRALVVDRSSAPQVKWLASAGGTTWTPEEAALDARLEDGTTIVDVSGLQEAGGLWLWATTAPTGTIAESIGVAFRKGSEK
jgi:hypothetical protein